MNVHLYYPTTTEERYSYNVAAAGKLFTWLLFQPERLPEVAHPSFREYLDGEGVTLSSLEALQDHQRRFGQPVLKRVNMFAVPPSKTRRRLDGSDERFTFDTLFELIFDARAEDLPADLQRWLQPGSTVPITLRMRGPYEIRPLKSGDAPVAGAKPGQLFVFSRSLWPLLERDMSTPHNQHEFVARQVRYYARHETPMSRAGADIWLPTWRAYNEIMGEQFAADPTVRSGE